MECNFRSGLARLTGLLQSVVWVFLCRTFCSTGPRRNSAPATRQRVHHGYSTPYTVRELHGVGVSVVNALSTVELRFRATRRVGTDVRKRKTHQQTEADR